MNSCAAALFLNFYIYIFSFRTLGPSLSHTGFGDFFHVSGPEHLPFVQRSAGAEGQPGRLVLTLC